VDEFTIKGCTKNPCLLKRGGSEDVTVRFKLPESVPLDSTIVVKIFGKVFVEIEWKTFEVGCKQGEGKDDVPERSCTTREQEFKYKLPIAKFYPAWKVPVFWKMYIKGENSPFIFLAIETELV
jgi:hypothetical protein